MELYLDMQCTGKTIKMALRRETTIRLENNIKKFYLYKLKKIRNLICSSHEKYQIYFFTFLFGIVNFLSLQSSFAQNKKQDKNMIVDRLSYSVQYSEENVSDSGSSHEMIFDGKSVHYSKSYSRPTSQIPQSRPSVVLSKEQIEKISSYISKNQLTKSQAGRTGPMSRAPDKREWHHLKYKSNNKNIDITYDYHALNTGDNEDKTLMLINLKAFRELLLSFSKMDTKPLN